MKAIRVNEWGGPEVLHLEEVPDPVAGPGQVVIVVKAVGVNPVDTYIRAGTYPRKPPLPYTPGSDAVGVIESVGAGVTRFAPGDRVYSGALGMGAYAEKTLLEESSVFPLPDHITFEQAAGINVSYATAYYALFVRAKVLPGETVLIHGASGGVGSAAVQLARAHGLIVSGTAGSEDGLKLVEKEGAHHVFSHKADGYLEAAKAQTPGSKGFDVIVEMLANVNLGSDLTVLAPKGRVVVVGNRGTVEINPRDTMGRDASILGMSLANASLAELASIHAALFAGLENGSLRPVVGATLPLSQAAKAHEDIIAPSGGALGKLVLIP